MFSIPSLRSDIDPLECSGCSIDDDGDLIVTRKYDSKLLLIGKYNYNDLHNEVTIHV